MQPPPHYPQGPWHHHHHQTQALQANQDQQTLGKEVCLGQISALAYFRQEVERESLNGFPRGSQVLYHL